MLLGDRPTGSHFISRCRDYLGVILFAMSKVNDDVMKRADIEKQLDRICTVFGVRFNAFFPGSGRSEIVVLGEKRV